VQGISASSYSAVRPDYKPGDRFCYSAVCGAITDVKDFKIAWDNADHETISSLLGYPVCCSDFFRKIWIEDGFMDTTWHMAQNTAGVKAVDQTIYDVEGPVQSNILWRWHGVRAVPHLPCSFACEATVASANRFIAIGKEEGYSDEMGWLLDILSWPVEWSGLHGIAEIKTPILKTSTDSDATAKKYVVRRKGDSYPHEGRRGLAFPYRQPDSRRVSESVIFSRGLKNPIRDVKTRPDWYFTDNGFTSRFTMQRAHEPIAELATAVLAGRSGTVLDLGSGNGALLEGICEGNDGIIPFGVDADADKIAHACELLPHYSDNFFVDDIFDIDEIWRNGRCYSVVVLMPGRLVEVSRARADSLRRRIKTHSSSLIVHAYGDWLTKYGDLNGLANKAGLRLLSLDSSSTASLASVR
jgi:hypothetical protein